MPLVWPPLDAPPLLRFRTPEEPLLDAPPVLRFRPPPPPPPLGVADLLTAGAALDGAGLDVLSAGADTQTAGTMSSANRHTNLFPMIVFVDSRDIIATSRFDRSSPDRLSRSFHLGLAAAISIPSLETAGTPF